MNLLTRLAFYGSEDLTPHEFYKEKNGRKAFADAEFVVQTCKSAVEHK